MKFSRLLCTLLVFCAAGSTAARADSFNFSFGSSSTVASGSGTLTATRLTSNPNEWLVTAITGTNSSSDGSSSPIFGLLAPGTFPTPTNGNTGPANDNNIFFSNGNYSLDFGGLSYLLAYGIEANLYGSAGQYFYRQACGLQSYLQSSPITLTATSLTPPASVAVTPEPQSFLLLGTGLVGVLAAARRRILA